MQKLTQRFSHYNHIARRVNSLISSRGEPLYPMVNRDGKLVETFPHSVRDLQHLTGEEDTPKV